MEFGVQIFWVLPRSIADTLFGWWNWPGKHMSSIWNLAPLCLMWCLWRERNRRTFEDMESSNDQLLASFSGSLFDWSRAWGLTSSDSLPLFLNSLLYNQFPLLSLFFLFSLSFQLYLSLCLMFFCIRQFLEYISLLLIKLKNQYQNLFKFAL